MSTKKVDKRAIRASFQPDVEQMVGLSFLLPERSYAALVAISELTGTKMGWHVREAIKAYMEEPGRKAHVEERARRAGLDLKKVRSRPVPRSR